MQKGGAAMTKTKRFLRILRGLVMLAFAVILIAVPKYSLQMVLGITGLGMSIRGIGTLWYYITMARSMVGGKRLLFTAIVYLDIGILTTSLANAPAIFVILYLAAVNAFAGVIGIMRARETKMSGSSHWKLRALHGAVNIMFAAAVVICGLILRMPQLAVYVYSAGLAYSAVTNILSAFRRTAIVYIQ